MSPTAPAPVLPAIARFSASDAPPTHRRGHVYDKRRRSAPWYQRGSRQPSTPKSGSYTDGVRLHLPPRTHRPGDARPWWPPPRNTPQNHHLTVITYGSGRRAQSMGAFGHSVARATEQFGLDALAVPAHRQRRHLAGGSGATGGGRGHGGNRLTFCPATPAPSTGPAVGSHPRRRHTVTPRRGRHSIAPRTPELRVVELPDHPPLVSLERRQRRRRQPHRVLMGDPTLVQRVRRQTVTTPDELATHGPRGGPTQRVDVENVRPIAWGTD